MNDLLTSRQVQDILKVDRITVYRMLQDGRLKGVKIGQQWRFPLTEVERLLGLSAPEIDDLPTAPGSGFPTHCAQTIQDLFAEIAQISAVIVNMQGEPLTQASHPTRFCEILLSSPTGKDACRAAWQSFARDSAPIHGAAGAKFFACPAGLQYIGAPIIERDTQVGLFLAGQFYWQPPDPREESQRIHRMAAAHNLPLSELQAAAREIPVIDPALHSRVETWPFTAARAVMSILHERQCFVERLQQIADLTRV